MLKKTLLTIPVILITLVVLGAVIALKNPEYYREQIKTTVEAETGFAIQINGEVKWRYWPPIAIRIEDVDIRSAGESRGASDSLGCGGETPPQRGRQLDGPEGFRMNRTSLREPMR